MRDRRHPGFTVIFVVVLAPLAAVVVITLLLLFGVEARVVFAAGHGVKALLRAWGVQAPNAVGVLVTVTAWWLLIVAAGLAWDHRRRGPGSPRRPE